MYESLMSQENREQKTSCWVYFDAAGYVWLAAAWGALIGSQLGEMYHCDDTLVFLFHTLLMTSLTELPKLYLYNTGPLKHWDRGGTRQTKGKEIDTSKCEKYLI